MEEQGGGLSCYKNKEDPALQNSWWKLQRYWCARVIEDKGIEICLPLFIWFVSWKE